VYDLFMVGSAAALSVRFGEHGVRLFSAVMIINAVLCGVAGVWASRRIRLIGGPLAFPLVAAAERGAVVAALFGAAAVLVNLRAGGESQRFQRPARLAPA